MNENVIDSVIVGGGLAGLSAALFLARAGRSTLVFDVNQPRIYAVEQVREYIGFDGQPPEAVLAQARQEAVRYGAIIRPEWVEHITPRPDGYFDVRTAQGTTRARTIVLANGLKEQLPPLEGLPAKWGVDVKVCPCFDGYEVRNQKYVVFGLPERLAHMASWVSMWSPDVTIVSPHAFSEADAERIGLLDIAVVAGEVKGLVHHDGKLVAVTTHDGRQVPCDATWIALNPQKTATLASTLCEVDDFGIAKVEYGGRTSRAGVFAIGNASNAWAHLAHAAAEGTTVGPVVTMYLLEQRIESLRQARKQAADVLA